MTAAARRPFVVGNWKMYNTVAESVALARAIADGARVGPRTDVAVAPVFTALTAVADALRGTRVGLSAQDVFWEPQGAYTGEVSAAMLRDAGCAYGIVGHSERRTLFGETDAHVHRKLVALRSAGVAPIACLGETLAERSAGATFDVVRRQLAGLLGDLDARAVAGLVLAYEPVWAIGTGQTAKPADAQLVHAFLRDQLRHRYGDAADAVRVLYGGSVKPDNAAELLAQPDVDGALVGGASLDAGAFGRIILAAG